MRVGSSEDGSLAFQELLRGRTPEFELHALVNRRLSWFSVRSDHVTVGRNLDWAKAWAAREELTYDPHGPLVALDLHAVVDASDRIHVVHEAFDSFGVHATNVGYKTSAAPSQWMSTALPSFVNPVGDPSCTSGNPGICLSADAAGTEWIHVLYHRRPVAIDPPDPAACHSFWYVYNAKPLSVADPGAGWVGESWFTDLFQDQTYSLAGEGGVGLLPVMDGLGRIHAIGRKKVTRSDSVWVYHVYGFPPAAGETWKPTVVALDSMPMLPAHLPAETPIVVTTQAVLGRSERGECLDVVWNHNTREEGAMRTEVEFARFDVGADVWSRPVQISPEDSVSSQAARLQRSPDGALHVMYHEPSPQDPASRVYYRRAVGDPRDPASWSTPQPVTYDVSGCANVPVFVAEGDTVWMGYTRHDPGFRRPFEAWFRKGWAIERHAAAHTTWSGLVWLDADYVVAEGDTLTILPGTLVVVAASSTADAAGFSPGKVDLVVEGSLEALGTPADSVRFETLAGSGRGSGWGGIRFTRTSCHDRIECARVTLADPR